MCVWVFGIVFLASVVCTSVVEMDVKLYMSILVYGFVWLFKKYMYDKARNLIFSKAKLDIDVVCEPGL